MYMDNYKLHQIFETGTDEPTEARLTAHAGDISAEIEAGALRSITVASLELCRQIDFPVRDRNWSTWPAQVTHENFEQRDVGFRYERRFDIAHGALSCCLVYEGNINGTVRATAEVFAHRDFVTNRTGFTLLHPVAGVAAQAVVVTTASGRRLQTHMPDLISPSQPIKDIAKLTFNIKGVALDIEFSGEVFEMEDQRNWSDASFKTYSRPLTKPYPYLISAGSTIRQSITLTIGAKAEDPNTVDTHVIRISGPLDEALPEILLAVQSDWFAHDRERAILSNSHMKSLLLRTTPERSHADIMLAKDLLGEVAVKLDLELVLEDSPAAPQLQLLVEACKSLDISPRHITSLPIAYLNSYQPDGNWPEGLCPQGAYEATRHAFRNTRIGSGMLSNFTELNRCPPDGLESDFITHGNTASFHAADDYSVCQTHETLPDIFRSARAIAGRRGYRLGLTAIGMRSNPYGEAVTPNPDQRRLTATMWDPRARALMGAAYAVGVLSATQGFDVEAVTLGAPIGPFGILSSPVDIARPWYDENPQACVYPIFHVMNTAALGGTRFQIDGLPTGLAGFAFNTGQQLLLIIANLSGESKTLTLGLMGRAAVLDVDSFEAAVCNPDWLAHSFAAHISQEIALSSCATLFLEVHDHSHNTPEQ